MELVNFTCVWPKLAAGSSFSRKSLGGFVCHSVRSLIGRKPLLKCLFEANFCRVTPVIRGGRAQVVGQSLIGRKASQVSRRSFASVSWRSGRGYGSGDRVYADRRTNGVRGSRARKSVVVRSQLTLITWSIIHFLFTCMSVAPRHRCRR